MSNLFDRALVSQEEKMVFERQLKVENENEDAPTENVNCSSNEHQVEINEKRQRQIIKNPMLLSPVIRCILQYLNLEEVKNSRYISREWKSVALNALTTRSKIKFYQITDAGNDSDRSPVNFFQTFSDTVDEIVPFTAFEITGAENRPQRIDELDYFFRKQQKYIRDLELKNVYLVDDCWQNIDSFDITPWISHSPMNEVNNKFNTRLSVYTNQSEKIAVDLRALVNIKELSLNSCKIFLHDNVLIRPRKSRLAFSTFSKNGIALSKVCVNDVVDFSKVKCITLVCHSDILYLDMSENYIKVQLEELALINITLRNWKTCQWTVNELTLSYTPFTEKTEMQIKNLITLSSKDQMDISVFPQSLEKLRLGRVDGRTLCSEPVVFQNLKLLDLNFFTNCFSTFSQNVKCPNLVELTLKRDIITSIETEFLVGVDLAWIPETVKILNLIAVTIENERNIHLHLEKLVLKDYTPFEMKEICGSHIQSKELVLCFRWDTIEADINFLVFLDYQKRYCALPQTIYVGFFDWERISDPFEESPLRNYVDKQAECYVFENQIGRAINRDEFRELLNKCL